jgi:mannose-1-phosphate guanylyltransferase
VLNGVITENTILVWYGDIIADINIEGLLRKHWESQATATLVLAENYQVPVGIPELQGDTIVNLQEKPWINVNPTIGILAIEKTAIQEAGETLGKSFDIMRDLIPHLIKTGLTVKAYIHNGYWYDIGSIERFQKIPREIHYILKTMMDD